ncbi:hypothetical protein [Roseiconus lacunae]|uniref:hypothetical protein n=1 Tax=Roseiconus lacunae TaxID=2605694 RepID=UPI0011F3B793|nr:hypothetical protein [Roseiconus lacunae]
MNSPTTATINGSQISLALTVGRKHLGKQNGTDLGNLESGIHQQIFMDPEVLCQVVWNHYQDRLQSIEIENYEQLQESMDGPTSRIIEDAMRGAIIDFFPWGKQVLDKMDQLIEKVFRENPSNPSGPTSGDLPDSLQSSPTN